MRIGVIGINHKLADLKLREEIAKACSNRFGSSHEADHDRAFVVLYTCNRTEIYFSSEDLAETHTYILSTLRLDVYEEFNHKLYSYFGVECFSHLTRVTSGLDSAIIFETDIQRQVKMAYMNAISKQILPTELHFVFQKALCIAKNVRSKLHLGKGLLYLENAMLQVAEHIFKILHEVRILFIGASQINQKIWRFLRSKNLQHITLCNRSEDKAQDIADNFRINILPWTEFNRWQEYDWVIFGTRATNYLVTAKSIKPNMCCKLLMDLCVPRNIEPRVGNDQPLTLLNIDQINNLLTRGDTMTQPIISEAEYCIDIAVQQYIARYHQRGTSKITFLSMTA